MKATDRFGCSARRLAMVLAGIFLCAAACLAQSMPGKVIVADVIPQGNRVVPTQKIMSLIKTRPGGEYNQEVVNEDVRRLYETRSFANIRVDRQPAPDGQVIVYFLLAELPSIVQNVVYQGAKHFKQDELDTLTSGAGVRKGAPLNPVANRSACQEIQRRYHEKGRMFSSVDLLEGGQPTDTRVVFNIAEGPVVKVSAIDITGNTFVSKARLKTQVNSSSQFLKFIGGTFNPMVADLDVSKLEEYYKTFGYQDVRVSRELQWDPDHRHVELVFHIHEGQRYRVVNLQAEGCKSLDQAKILSLCTLRNGEFYDKTVVQADLNTIKDMIGYTGRSATTREVLFYPKPGEVAVHYEIQERPPDMVGQIIIVNNEVTRENIIRRQVPLYPGQILTYPDLRVAERNLARLNIFEMNPDQGIRPTVSVLDPDSDNPYKDILVSVQETRTGSLLFGLGVNSDAGLTGSVVLNERNFDILRPPTSLDDLLSGRSFRGAGQEFRMEAVPGTNLQRYTVSFREPFLFDSPYSLGVSGYYYTRRFDEYDETRLGTRITLARKLNQFWSVSTGVRVEQVGVNNVPFFAPVDFRQVAGDNFLVALRGGLSRDSRDSYLRPTEGSLLEASYEQGLGDFTFPVVTVEGNKYWTMYQRPDGSGRHVLAARSQASWAGSDTPLFERFYAGGFRTMRGFEFRGIGPDVNGFKVGGEFMFLNSLEYQVPIKANDQFYLVFFADSGTVERDSQIRDYRVAVGAGMRIVVPMLGPVPIALDFGFPVVKTDRDQDQIFSFWVGFFN